MTNNRVQIGCSSQGEKAINTKIVNKQEKRSGVHPDSALMDQVRPAAIAPSVPVQARFGHSFARLPLTSPSVSAEGSQTLQKQGIDAEEEIQRKAEGSSASVVQLQKDLHESDRVNVQIVNHVRFMLKRKRQPGVTLRKK